MLFVKELFCISTLLYVSHAAKHLPYRTDVHIVPHALDLDYVTFDKVRSSDVNLEMTGKYVLFQIIFAGYHPFQCNSCVVLGFSHYWSRPYRVQEVCREYSHSTSAGSCYCGGY